MTHHPSDSDNNPDPILPHDPLAALQQSWESNADAWTAAVRSGAIESRRLATDAAIVSAALTLKPAKALDLGCGEGWLAGTLAQHGIEIVGIDGSAGLINAARSTWEDCRFQRLDYAELVASPALAKGPYDVFLANFSLFDKELEPLLQALRAIALPDARLLIQTLHPANATGPYRDGWRSEDFRGFSDQPLAPMPWYFRTLGSWLELLPNSGWQLERLSEPLHPETERPLSLLLQARLIQSR